MGPHSNEKQGKGRKGGIKKGTFTAEALERRGMNEKRLSTDQRKAEEIKFEEDGASIFSR